MKNATKIGVNVNKLYLLPKLTCNNRNGFVKGLSFNTGDVLLRPILMMVTPNPLSSMFHSVTNIYICVILDGDSYAVWFEHSDNFTAGKKSMLFRNGISTVTSKYCHVLFPEISRYNNADKTDYEAFSALKPFRIRWAKYKVENLTHADPKGIQLPST